MGELTTIPWTRHTWNPHQGCRHKSEGCKFCYMFRDKRRYGQDPERIHRSSDATFSKPLKWQKEAAAAGRKYLVFTCSWSDWFIEEADAWRADEWAIVRACPDLTFQILTKRPERIPQCLPPDWGDGYPNVWLGVTAENQKRADERIPILLGIPAAVRFISAEPLLGPIDFRSVPGFNRIGLDLSGWWVIVGGESGPNRRECEVEWIAYIAGQCRDADVPVFVKQDAGPRDGMQGRIPDDLWALKQFPAA